LAAEVSKDPSVIIIIIIITDHLARCDIPHDQRFANIFTSPANRWQSLAMYATFPADSGGHVVYSVGLELLDCWDRGFESR